ncbi:MAG: hypothetical protein EA425_17685 [Puniceicoccaceae bacterium]|nr:MAG: hypothetical protein EA425_17685 [Puniceicoccaceae bacterium]
MAAFWRWNWVSGRLQSDFSKAQIVTTLEAEQTLTNCHAVLLIEDPHGYYSASWRHIGTLRAGREHLLRIDVDAPNWWQRRLSLLIFSNGAEVVTTKRMQPTHLPPSEDLDFINQRSEELAAAAETGVTAPSRLVADLAPVFPGALEGERAMTAEVTVDTKGRISGVRLDSRAGQILATDILRSLARARFIPALKEGRPVESVLTVDIPFD